MNTFTSCFFFFAGFEFFSTAGKNVNNPEKNIGKGITLIMIIMTVFYAVISLIFFLGYSVFVQNMNMGAWSPFTSKIIIYGGPIIMIISGLALKINIAMQNALYGGTTLQPLSKEGYISFNYVEKYGWPKIIHQFTLKILFLIKNLLKVTLFSVKIL
ncbi:hypothetical protein [Spiroplasma endosymbiont of Amphimallon solstitiale]|uniref:hypothetical protein n=1 Tax=Spiroplasma endosymbiont of Amphimallon solstitiale TaxID=3066288 RepID=UPI00313D2886